MGDVGPSYIIPNIIAMLFNDSFMLKIISSELSDYCRWKEKTNY